MPITGYSDSLFGEGAVPNEKDACFSSKIKFGALHVVDHGAENMHSPTGHIYLIGHGASDPLGWESWMQGSEVYMARVQQTTDPSILNDPTQYELWGGAPVGWIGGGDVSKARPVLTWANRTGVTTQTWVPALGRYLTAISTPADSPKTQSNFTTYILESTAPTGPFEMLVTLQNFGPQAYFVAFPSAFMAESKNADGSFEAVLSYSQNWNMHNLSIPPGPLQSKHQGNWVLQHVRLS
jgi:hypothetical protein